MLMNKRGLVTALLCVALMMIFGCTKDEPLYTTGLAAQTEAGSADTAVSASESEAADTAADSVSAGLESDVIASADGTADNAGASGSLGTLAGLDTGTESVQAGTEAQTEAIVGYVYVCGAVKEPGVYPVTTDMRVCDAVALAGGFSSEADEEWLNQAAAVSDGQKLYIYTMEETDLMRASGMTAEGMSTSDSSVSGSTDSVSAAGTVSAASADMGNAAATGTGASGADSSDGKVNLNTAAHDELMTLPGIGESKADAIIAYREEHGAFASIEEIQNISGIKSGVFSQIKDFITV
ncbi:MAG: helix-hairpin-helix domain-containing protein [Lachnospiraceae bacterium]|nr:helix-hairpin-helix domain-containing protein [Lachnospiraceae bacterium]